MFIVFFADAILHVEKLPFLYRTTSYSLGILHDGRGNNCDTDKYIMSEKTGPGKVNWSPCSNKYLENFLAYVFVCVCHIAFSLTMLFKLSKRRKRLFRCLRHNVHCNAHAALTMYTQTLYYFYEKLSCSFTHREKVTYLIMMSLNHCILLCYFSVHISRGNARCLDDDAIPSLELDFDRVHRLPGEQYTPDIQCQLALGSQYKAYHSPKEPFNVSI